jgi:hypothetical protein
VQLNLILDKSSFQGLTIAEHIERDRYFLENVTPVLLREILGDLSKEEPGRLAEDTVKGLAKKFGGSGGQVNVDYRDLCLAELDGVRIPLADGQIVPDHMTVVEQPDGSTAGWLEPGPWNYRIIQWARRKFIDGERLAAKRLRDEARSFHIDSMLKRLRRNQVLLPKARNFDDLREVVGDLLDRRALRPVWLSWVLEEVGVPASVRDAARHRWRASGGPALESFAPYLAFCTKTFLLFAVGTHHGLLTARPTNRVDIEYLLYLPFCEVFVSDDKLHRQLAPMLLRDHQSFVEHKEFRADLTNRIAQRAALGRDVVARRSFAFGSYPWPVKGSVLTRLWLKHHGPWGGSGNRAVQLSEAEKAVAYAEAEDLVRAAE